MACPLSLGLLDYKIFDFYKQFTFDCIFIKINYYESLKSTLFFTVNKKKKSRLDFALLYHLQRILKVNSVETYYFFCLYVLFFNYQSKINIYWKNIDLVDIKSFKINLDI